MTNPFYASIPPPSSFVNRRTALTLLDSSFHSRFTRTRTGLRSCLARYPQRNPTATKAPRVRTVVSASGGKSRWKSVGGIRISASDAGVLRGGGFPSCSSSAPSLRSGPRRRVSRARGARGRGARRRRRTTSRVRAGASLPSLLGGRLRATCPRRRRPQVRPRSRRRRSAEISTHTCAAALAHS